MQKTISAEELLKIVQVVLKDELAAVIRKRGDELTITFPAGSGLPSPCGRRQKILDSARGT